MAISEQTKIIVHGQVVSGMRARWNKLKADRDDLVAKAQAVQAEMDQLKNNYEVLITDIPEPTPPPP